MTNLVEHPAQISPPGECLENCKICITDGINFLLLRSILYMRTLVSENSYTTLPCLQAIKQHINCLNSVISYCHNLQKCLNDIFLFLLS